MILIENNLTPDIECLLSVEEADVIIGSTRHSRPRSIVLLAKTILAAGFSETSDSIIFFNSSRHYLQTIATELIQRSSDNDSTREAQVAGEIIDFLSYDGVPKAEKTKIN